MKGCRHSVEIAEAVVGDAGETIEDDFRIADRGLHRSRLDEYERGGCDNPMNGLHDYLPRAGPDALRWNDYSDFHV